MSIQSLLNSPSDGTYPDPNTGGYKKHDCGIYTPASVISTSYGSNEADLTPAYEIRQCNECVFLSSTVLGQGKSNGAI